MTGSAGFIGYHLTKSLLDDDHEILGIDNINDYYDTSLKNARINKLKSYPNFFFKKIDIVDKKSLKKCFYSFNPKNVINLASQPGVRYSSLNPNIYINSNIVGFLNIIELSKQFNVEGFFYASSSAIYGQNDKIPFELKNKLSKPISLYGITKLTNELIAYSYSQLYGIRTTGLRYFTVYGPWYRPDMALFIFIDRIISNQPIKVFNNGNMKRDFTYIDDIIDGTRSAIKHNYKCEIFNLGSSNSENLLDVIHIIENELGKKAIIDFLPKYPEDNLETCANIKYSEKKINFYPKTNVKKGIPMLIKWYKEYYNVS